MVQKKIEKEREAQENFLNKKKIFYGIPIVA